MLGVTIGIATLVASVSVGLGVRRIVEDGFKNERRLREITVYPGFDRGEKDEYAGVPDDALKVEGEMSDARRERIRKHLAREWREQHTQPAPKPLTPQQLQQFATWDHVVHVEPDLFEMTRFAFRGQIVQGSCSGFTGETDKLPHGDRIWPAADARRPTRRSSTSTFSIASALHSDAEVQACIGQSLKYDFVGREGRRPEALLILFDADPTRLTETELQAMARARELLPKAVEGLDLTASDKEALLRALGRKRKRDASEKDQPSVSGEFKIVGVFREVDKKKDGELFELFVDGLDGQVVIPRDTAERLFSKLPVRENRGYNRAIITVDSDDNLKEVTDRLKAEGYHFFAIGLFLQMARKNVLLMGFTMDFVALLALTVACLGIMNTMFTAVLERTREIGVMKAVGAKDRHIMAMFLVEGGLDRPGRRLARCIDRLASLVPRRQRGAASDPRTGTKHAIAGDGIPLSVMARVRRPRIRDRGDNACRPAARPTSGTRRTGRRAAGRMMKRGADLIPTAHSPPPSGIIPNRSESSKTIGIITTRSESFLWGANSASYSRFGQPVGLSENATRDAAHFRKQATSLLVGYAKSRFLLAGDILAFKGERQLRVGNLRDGMNHRLFLVAVLECAGKFLRLALVRPFHGCVLVVHLDCDRELAILRELDDCSNRRRPLTGLGDFPFAD